METKLPIPLKKKKEGAESPHLDPLMRALKTLHSAGAPEAMTGEELERQRRSQEVLGRLAAPMAGMEYEEFLLSGMNAAWTRRKAPGIPPSICGGTASTFCALPGTRGCTPAQGAARCCFHPGWKSARGFTAAREALPFRRASRKNTPTVWKAAR